jgi:dTDP-4-amino-4,6-dideoxygalactose transaminase
MIDLPRAHAPLAPELIDAFSRVLASGQFILGDEVSAFERELERELGVEHAIAVSSGSDALLLSLQALGIGPGDDVLCPAFTFFATAGSVWRAGARPVFTDVSADTGNATRAAFEARITPRTRALVVVHLFGRLAEMEPILDLARQRDLHVIEDAAQAIGARAGGRAAGAFGDTGCFSFFPTKNLGAFGDGGLVTTASAELADRIRVLRHQGQSGRYVHDVVGGAFRLDALQAALLRVKLPHVAGWNAKRRRVAARYDELLRAAGLAAPRVAGRGSAGAEGARALREVDDGAPVVLPAPAGDAHIYHQYVIRVRDGARDALRAHLDRDGIASQIYYPIPLHLQPCFAELGGHAGDLPVAERLVGEVLALPIHPDLDAVQQTRVVESVAAFFTGRRPTSPPSTTSRRGHRSQLPEARPGRRDQRS